MRVAVVEKGGRSRWVELDATTLLGKGGEKTVHRDPEHPRSRGLAVYHDPTPQRARKVQRFLQLGINWPDQVIAPDQAVVDDRGQIVGFGMKLLPRSTGKWKDLFTPSFCTDNKITTKIVAGMGLTVLGNLNALHPAGITVGDLNDGGVLFGLVDHEVYWVDVDSWDIPGHPCIVGTEMYLVPNLYNVDLSRGGKHFEPWMDHYSFALLLSRGILRKHLFKAGDHPLYPGVLERAAAGVTCFDPGVDTSGLKGWYPELLTDELTAAIIAQVKRQTCGPFPTDVLREYHDELAECHNCGQWYPVSRRKCPVCSEVTTVDVTKVLGVEIVTLISAQGRILHVQLDGTTVWCVAEEHGALVVYRKDENQAVAKQELGIAWAQGMRFGVFRKTLVICIDEHNDDETGKLFLIEPFSSSAPNGVAVVPQTTTDILAGQAPVFSTSRRFLYRLAGNMLVREARFGPTDLLPRQVVQVLRNQCWFAADPNPAERETVFGVNRDVSAEHWFVAVSDKTGESFTWHTVPIPVLARGESMRDLSVRFDDRTILVMRQTLYRGRLRIRLETVNADSGAVLSSEIVDPQAAPQWDAVHGKAFKNGLVMHPSDDGVIVEPLATHAAQNIPPTASVVSADDALYPFGGGFLVVSYNNVTLVTKK